MENHIEVYSNALPDGICDHLIQFFEHHHSEGRTWKGDAGRGGVESKLKNSHDLLIDLPNWKYKCNIPGKSDCKYHDSILNEIIYILQQYSYKYFMKYLMNTQELEGETFFDFKHIIEDEFGRDYFIPDDMINTTTWERFRVYPYLWKSGLYDMHYPEFGDGGLLMKKYVAKEKQGFHRWHFDQGDSIENALRQIVCQFYINDVEEGGETEFKHQELKIKPKKGTLVMFPTSYTHIHKGNVPISNDKYILNVYLSKRMNIGKWWNWNKDKIN